MCSIHPVRLTIWTCRPGPCHLLLTRGASPHRSGSPFWASEELVPPYSAQVRARTYNWTLSMARRVLMAVWRWASWVSGLLGCSLIGASFPFQAAWRLPSFRRIPRRRISRWRFLPLRRREIFGTGLLPFAPSADLTSHPRSSRLRREFWILRVIP